MVLGIVCFYVTYVSYRNLKSFLPLVSDRMYDRELHMLDQVLFFGHDPGDVLHDLLGTTVVAHVAVRRLPVRSCRWCRSW